MPQLLLTQIFSMLSAVLLAASLMPAQVPQKGPPRDPNQSPAASPRPKAKALQTYPVEQIQAGELRFAAQCGFCHGRDAAGGESAPDLTRSELVAQDVHGDKLGAPHSRRTRRCGNASV